MQDIHIREAKMKERAKSFTFRQFVQRLCSREPMNFYRYPEGISIYPDTPRRWIIKPPKVYEQERDGLTDYGRDYDFSKSFRENFGNFFHEIPKIAIRAFPPYENSDYAEWAFRWLKNGYLCVGAGLNCENIMYSLETKESCRNVLNSIMVRNNCQNIYRSTAVFNSYNIFYSRLVNNSSDVWFSSNMVGCHDCLLCTNLLNQSYCIQNQAYPKEEYLVKKEEFLAQKEQFMQRYDETKTNEFIISKNVTGHFFIESQNVQDGLYAYRMRDSQNIFLSGSINGNSEVVNGVTLGAPRLDKAYNVVNSGEWSNLYSSDYMGTCTNCYYSYFLENCSYCLWCVGLKNKQFCILNKEYSKEERHELADKIFAQMDQEWALGDFFPGSMNPYYFNDTAAYLIDDSFTKEEVTKEGYLWRDEAMATDIPAWAEVVRTKELSNFQRIGFNGNREIDPNILKKVIKDEKGNCYRIVKMEYDFLVKYGLPLPELHRLERIKLGFKFK